MHDPVNGHTARANGSGKQPYLAVHRAIGSDGVPMQLPAETLLSPDQRQPIVLGEVGEVLDVQRGER
jgi:hypothetical protein